MWSRNVQEEEKAENEVEEGPRSKKDMWRLLVKLVEHNWKIREAPTKF